MMINIRPTGFSWKVPALAAFLLVGLGAQGSARAGFGDIFYIDMENHNATQPSSVTSPAPIYGNSAAPYINSLITSGNPNAAQTSYASNYLNVAPGVHPSLPNYLWQEAGTNNGVANDNQPFGTGGANQGNTPSLTALLQAAGISWKSYQEDIDINTTTGAVLPQSQWTVPLTNQSGTFAAGATPNPYNGTLQYNFATKHDGSLYYNATNGGNDPSTSNPEIPHYARFQQLTTDLNNNTVARYNLITPDQFNDMHTALSSNFTYNGVTYTAGTDAEAIAQGDSFLSKIVPQIMASQAYKNGGAIVIWFDETEGGDTSSFTLPEIVISPLAKGNAFNSTLTYTHSSDLKTLQEVYGVTSGGLLGDAANANDLSALFQPGVIPAATVPEPASVAMTGLGLFAVAAVGRRRLAGKAA